MRIDVDVDASRLLLRLRNGEKRLAYAVANAINETAKVIQKSEQEQVKKEFTVRKQFTLRQAAVIKPFASARQGRPFAEIRVGQRDRLLLSRFEEGGERPTATGSPSAAVPVIGGPARPSFARPVPKPFQLLDLALASDVQSRQIKGRRRTFVLFGTARAKHGGVYQRVGKKRGDIRMIYSFKRGLRLDDRLHFVDTASGVSRRIFGTLLRKEVAATLARNPGR